MKLLYPLLTIILLSSCSIKDRMDKSNELLKEATQEMKETKVQVIEANKKLDEANKNIKTASELMLSVVPTMNQINTRIQTVSGQLELLSTDLSELAGLAKTFNGYAQRDEFTAVIDTLLSNENGFIPLFNNASELLDKMNNCTVEVFRPEYLPKNKEEALKILKEDYNFNGDIVWDSRGYYTVPKKLKDSIPLQQKELITAQGSFCEMVTATALLNTTRTVMHLGELIIDSGMADQVDISTQDSEASDSTQSSLFEVINKENIKKEFSLTKSKAEKDQIRADIKKSDEKMRNLWKDFATADLNGEFKYGSEEADRLLFTHYQAEIAVYKVALAKNKAVSRRAYLISQFKNYLPYIKMMLLTSDKQLLKSIDKMVLPKVKVKLKHQFNFSALNMLKSKRNLVETLRNAMSFYYDELDSSSEDYETRRDHLYNLMADLFYYYYDTEYTLHLLNLSNNKKEQKEKKPKEEEKGFFRGLFGDTSLSISRSLSSVKKKAL